MVYLWGSCCARKRVGLRSEDGDVNRQRCEKRTRRTGAVTEVGTRSFLGITAAAISGASWIVSAGAAISSFQCRDVR